MVPYLQQAWKAIGVDIQPQGLPQPSLIDKVFANDFQLSLLGITWTEEDQGTFYRTGVGFNLSHYSNPEYDKLIVELGKTAKIEERATIARKLNDMITKDSMTIVPLVDRGRVSAHANSLGGVVLNTWDSELWNVADWYRVK